MAFRVVCACIILGVALAACGDDSTPPPDSNTGSNDGALPDGASNDGTVRQDAFTPDGDVADTAMPPPDTSTPGNYMIPALAGDVYFGHFLSPYPIHGFDADRASIATRDVGVPTGDLTVFGNTVATTREGGSEVRAFDATTLMPIDGSPYDTANLSTSLAHDPVRNRLYVYCIGVAGDPSMSNVSVFDTSSTPWTEISGSPFTIDVAAFQIKVDPVTGNLVGVSGANVWMVETAGFTHVGASPIQIEPGRGSDIVVDPSRRRLYWSERDVGTQTVHEHDLDTFAALGEVTFSGTSIGDIAVHLRTGDVWAVDFGASKLRRFTAMPLTLADACTDGCSIPLTETGLAIDYDRNRLYVAHIPDAENPDTGPGWMTAWDIAATPPTELTEGNRPALGLYPLRVTMR